MRVTITKPARRKAKAGPKLMTGLELAAIHAHDSGRTWSDFISEYNPKLRQAEPVNLTKYRKLRSRLLDLLTNGDPAKRSDDGNDDELPRWERDDLASRLG